MGDEGDRVYSMSMEVGNDKPVSQWSNDEIQAALVTLGSANLPVTRTTRPLLERKIEKLLFKKQQEPTIQHTDDPQLSNQAQLSVGACPEGLADSQTAQLTPDTEYYGVSAEVSTGTTAPQTLSPFYTTQSDAVRAIKSIPGARFKKFTTRASAEAFSSSPVDHHTGGSLRGQSPATTTTTTTTRQQHPVTDRERSNQFPSVKTQDLSRFRQLVEGGDVGEVSRVVWANPRYLVNCGSDTPEIVQPGFRYNVLHCAVQAGKLEICKAGYDVGMYIYVVLGTFNV